MAYIDENTVPAANQLKDTECITFEGLENTGPRILFAGNSITRHAAKAELGWHGNWGMAASAKEKDYVHLCMAQIRQWAPDTAFCVCQVSRWERSYAEGSTVYPLYENARAFQADIIIMRAVENCPRDGFDPAQFAAAYADFLQYLNPTGKAQYVLTTGFWHHSADDTICAVAKQLGAPVCLLGDLGSTPEMKAIGLFQHKGVAAHPGDLGMQTIARRICDALHPLLNAKP